jgi:hypothetical protein
MLVLNLSLFDDTKRWTDRTEELCNELENHKPICDISTPRIMITGSPTVFPTWKIPVLLEESGGVIVMDDICTGSKELWDPIETAHWTMNDMLIAMADKYLMNTCACFTPNLVRRDRIIQFTEDFKIDGVLYHVLQACHIYGMEEQRIEKALDEKNIPMLSIETDYSQEDVEQIRTRVEAFLEMVSIRKSAKVEPFEQAPPPVQSAAMDVTATITQAQPQQPAQAAAAAPAPAPPPPTASAPAQASDPTPVSTPTAPPQANDPTPISSPVSPTTPPSTPTQSPTHTQPSTPTQESTQTPSKSVTMGKGENEEK